MSVSGLKCEAKNTEHSAAFCLQQPLNLQPNTKCLTRRLICLVSLHAEFTQEDLVIITTATRVPEKVPLCLRKQGRTQGLLPAVHSTESSANIWLNRISRAHL